MMPLPIIVIVAAVLLYLLFWPVPVKPVKWKTPKAPKLEGDYAVNQALAALERLPTGGRGPEDVIFGAQGWLYTGLEDGRIIRMQPDGSQREVFADTGGRPLGLAVDAAGNLLVADADEGLLSVDPDGKVTVLVNEYDGRKLVLTNHLDVAADGTIYFTETSHRFPLSIYIADILENRPNGRLLAYDPKSGQTRLVVEGLYFANGVAINPDQSFLLVAETSRFRLQRVWLAGDKAGQAEIFVDNLPGFPDNLHHNGRDEFWVALISPRKPEVDAMAPLPLVRKMIYRLPPAMRPKATRYGFVLGLDENGRVLHNLQDPSGDFPEISGATEHEGNLYLGSLSDEAVGRLSL